MKIYEGFTAMAKMNMFGDLKLVAKGSADELIAGVLTLLEKVVRENEIDREAVIKAWRESADRWEC